MRDTAYKTEKRELTAYEKKMLIFFLKCMASEFSKTFIFSIVFSILGLSREFWAALFFMMLYRTSSGGLHCKTYLSCLSLSFLILLSGILLGIYIHINPAFKIPMTLAMAAVGYFLSPVQAPTRPPLEDRLVMRARQRTFMAIMVFFVLLCITPTRRYTNIGFWLLVLHDVQLIIAYQIRRLKKI